MRGGNSLAGQWAVISPRRIVLTAAGLALAGVLVWEQGLLWPDEIFQTVEQAHRLAFGYGFVPWEFRAGARHWLLPGLLTPILGLGEMLGVAPVLAARAAMAVLSGLTVSLTIRAGTSLGSPRVGWFGGLLLAAFPPFLVLGTRCLSEVPSACLLALVLCLCTRPPARRAMVLAGVAAGAMFFVRYTNAPLLWLPLALAWQQSRRQALTFAGALSATLAMGGAVDWLTWGSPFASLTRYLAFNLVEGQSQHFGTAPGTFYAVTVYWVAGPVILVWLAAAAMGACRLPLLAAAVLAYVAVLSLVGHKELRFLYPAAPGFFLLAGVGLDRIARRTDGIAAVPYLTTIATVVLAGTMAARSIILTRHAFGYQQQGSLSVWRFRDAHNRLLWEAAGSAQLCGLAAMGLGPLNLGGYAYLHRPVPFLDPDQYERLGPRAVSHIIAPATARVAPHFRPVVTVRGITLFARPGSCEPSLEEWRRLANTPHSASSPFRVTFDKRGAAP